MNRNAVQLITGSEYKELMANYKPLDFVNIVIQNLR